MTTATKANGVSLDLLLWQRGAFHCYFSVSVCICVIYFVYKHCDRTENLLCNWRIIYAHELLVHWDKTWGKNCVSANCCVSRELIYSCCKFFAYLFSSNTVSSHGKLTSRKQSGRSQWHHGPTCACSVVAALVWLNLQSFSFIYLSRVISGIPEALEKLTILIFFLYSLHSPLWEISSWENCNTSHSFTFRSLHFYHSSVYTYHSFVKICCSTTISVVNS